MVDDEDLTPLRSIRSYDEADSDEALSGSMYAQLVPAGTFGVCFCLGAAQYCLHDVVIHLGPQPHHNINYYDESVELRRKGIRPVNGNSQDMPRILRSRSPSLRICPRRGCSNEGEFTDFNSYTGKTFG